MNALEAFAVTLSAVAGIRDSEPHPALRRIGGGGGKELYMHETFSSRPLSRRRFFALAGAGAGALAAGDDASSDAAVA